MGVSLKKGQKVDLKKSNGDSLKHALVGLGWDAVQEKKGFFSSLFSSTPDFDCDASVIMCQNGKLKESTDVIYFGNLKHTSGSVVHTGDNRTGAGDGDDEQIKVDLSSVPPAFDKLVFVVNIYQAKQRSQHFGMIRNAFIRIVDSDTNQEICRFDLTDNYDNMTAMIFGELYRKDGEWKFNAIGQGTTDATLQNVVGRYQ